MAKTLTRPLIGVGLCIIKDGKILLTKRKGKHCNGMYGFPGGHLEKWEYFETTALRELKEECGNNIKVSKPKLLSVYNTIFKKENKHYVLIMMVSKWIKGYPIITEPHKNEEWQWFDWDNLPAPLMPGIKMMLKEFNLKDIDH